LEEGEIIKAGPRWGVGVVGVWAQEGRSGWVLTIRRTLDGEDPTR
jgi:hypothetical protein